MGISASLFFNTDAPENCLDWRVRPSDEQYDSQKERWNDLAVYLRDDLAKRSGCTIAWWLQGSYKFGTQIRPAGPDEEFDIDVGIYFQWAGEPDDGEHGPLDLKTFVQDSLTNYCENDGNEASEVEDPPKARCSRVHFKDSFHIDVPSYHLDRDRDARALATAEDEWEDSDPKAIYGWWKNSIAQADRPRCRRLVRYFKMWAALRFEEGSRPSSILLTILVGEAFQELDKDQFSGDDEFLTATLRVVVDRLQRSFTVKNPVNKFENLNRLSQDDCLALLNKLEEFLSIAERGLVATTKTAAADVWSEAFDQFFPIPEEDDEEEAVLKEAQSRALATLAFNPIVDVTATVGSRTFNGVDGIGPIPKGCEITFTLANAHSLPSGAEVRWVVRNSGREAEEVNDLGHRAGDGISTSRDSAYRGDHYMDVSVRLNGRLIGSKRVRVVVSGLGLPKRNPPRPSWTSLRRKR
jgi:hypothetical protein